MATKAGERHGTHQGSTTGVTRQRTSAPALISALTSKGVLTAAMLPLTATSTRRPHSGDDSGDDSGDACSVFIKRF